MPSAKKIKKKFLSLPNQILLGAVLGILAGLFFGQWCLILQPLTTIYSRLLEVVAFPYIICVLIANLGRMAPRLAARLLTRGWHYYAFLVLLCFLVIRCAPWRAESEGA